MMVLHQQTDKGFTLLELIISVIVIGILAGVVSPNFLKFKDEFELESAYKLFIRELEYAQNLSINRNEIQIDEDYKKIFYGVHILNENTYQIGIFSQDFELLREFSEPKKLSDKTYIKFNFSEELINNEYIIFTWRGQVIFVDFQRNIISIQPDENFFYINSQRVNFNLYIRINPTSGKIIHE